MDGIYVDEQLKRVDIFSASLVTSAKSAGDVKLKEFVGSLNQFNSSTSVKQLQVDVTNVDLKRILEDQEIAKKLEDGFHVHGVYVTNATRDDQTNQYLQHTPNITF